MTKAKFAMVTTIILLVTVGLMACASDPEKKENKRYLSAPALTTPDGHGYGIGWERGDCLSCHVTENLKERSHPYFLQVTGTTMEETCAYCHLGNGYYDITVPKCVECHSDKNIFTKHINADATSKHLAAGGKTFTDMDCIACHENTDMNGVFDMTKDLTRRRDWDTSDLSNFCLTCHDGIASFYANDIHGSANGKRTDTTLMYEGEKFAPIGCMVCHDQHTSDNDKLMIGSTNKMKEYAPINVDNLPITEIRDLCASCHIGEDWAGSVRTPNGQQQVTVHTTPSSSCVQCHEQRITMNSGQECARCHTHGVMIPGDLFHDRF